ncbi:FkbM family methyltransferase [Pseudoalteromonas sp. MMG024]|uniref:FkbM family methyltransferase n=1 Tax=Pseudoalteromonas sp. MMG024 TaxID=2909980 RepID=UPI001F2AA768|nr:FkbM family methyltransferase [Pseudoalteromonas sp. MMG024]
MGFETKGIPVKFYGQFEPQVDNFIYSRYVKHNEFLSQAVCTFIECGAFDGVTESSCLFFEESLGWTGYNIEASPTIYAELIKNRPNTDNFNLALSDSIGEIEFTDVHHPSFPLCTNGSVSHTPEHVKILNEMNCEFTTCKTNKVTYREFINENGITDITLMVLDIEGHEIQALKGFENVTVLPKIFCIEHGHLGVETLREYVEPLGYIFDTTSHVNSYFLHESVYIDFLPSIIKSELDLINTSSNIEEIELLTRSIENKAMLLHENYKAKAKRVDSLMNSLSWRITKPLRFIVGLISKN